MHGSGRLAIWNSCKAGWEAKYERWYQSEHLIERLSVPGFERGRRYASINRPNAFFTYYETTTPEILISKAYLERVNNPTPMTAEIMRSAFAEMSRTVCRNLFSIGGFRGAFAATLVLDTAVEKAEISDWARDRLADGTIARIESWQAVEVDTAPSAEAKLRGADRQIQACMLVEALSEHDCARAVAELAGQFGRSTTEARAYRLLCELTAS
ncbi:MAG: hypothetical protein AAGA26_04305 [Pseudomonadota bacterium]